MNESSGERVRHVLRFAKALYGYIVVDLGRLNPVTLSLLEEVNDVYVVTAASGSEILLPAIPEVVLDVDLPRKTMRVHLLPGLVPSESEEA